MENFNRVSEAVAHVYSSTIPLDRYNYYTLEYKLSREKGSTMPVGPLFKGVDMTYSMGLDDHNESVIHVDATFTPTDWATSILKEFPIDRIKHRSRVVTIASSFLRYKELNRRIDRKREYVKYLSTLKRKYNGKFSGLIDYRKGLINRYASPEAVKGYMLEHKHSSIMPGVKWGSLDADDEVVRQQVYDTAYKAALTPRKEMYFSSPFYQGMRSRALSLDECSTFDVADDGRIHVKGDIIRTRIVMFHPLRSLTNAVIKEKPLYYLDWISWAKDNLGLQSDIQTPLVEGGKVYLTARDWIKQGFNHVALDGKNHESNVIDLLGPETWDFGTCLQEQIHLPSGISETSIFGLLASLCYVKEIEESIGPMKAILLGDDINIFLDDNQKTRLKSIPLLDSGLVEEDEADSKMNYILGLSVMKGFVGLKFMQDSADKMLGLNDLTGGGYSASKKVDIRVGTFIYEAWFNRIGTKDMVQVMAGIKAEDFKGPGIMIEKEVEKYAKKYKQKSQPGQSL